MKLSQECNNDCSSCKQSCDERKTDFKEKPHELSKIKKVIGVISGKGGVGKSLITSISATVKQFWTDVIWQDVDYMFIDMPPGTGDVALTVFQSIPIDGIIIVSSPQELVSMIVKKAVKMAKMMDIPILGIIENLSYIKCPSCKEKINLYGESKIQDVANEYNIKLIERLPIDPQIASLCDKGQLEQGSWPPIWSL